MKMLWLALSALGVLATAGDAQAFSEITKFEASPLEGGGGGRFFTGSPADGYSCTVCHQGGPTPNVFIQGLPVNGFQPGATYDIAVTFDQPEVSHAISLEFMTETGEQAGTVALPENAETDPALFCSQDLTLFSAAFVMPVGKRTIVGLKDCDAGALRFRFTAPDVPRVAFSLGMVTSNEMSDTFGDGSIQVKQILKRFGEGSTRSASACSVRLQDRSTRSPRYWVISGIVMLALLYRRRSRRLLAAVLVSAFVLLPGCARVAPYERGTLARRDMELGASADLTAGEEHAVAYREGSSGGGAAKGGGCGCN